MRWSLIALLLLGCGDSGELAALKSALANAQESIVETQATQIDKTDEAIEILRDNTTALAAIKSQIDALQVKSETPKVEEVIKSALESPPAKDANDSQPSTKIVAQPAGTRRTSDGTVLRWNIEGNWNPTILETSAHLREHGINTDGMTHQQMADLHASIHEGKPVAMKSETVRYVSRGANCPNGQCPTSSTRYVRRSRR
jgi:hypothetical protein